MKKKSYFIHFLMSVLPTLYECKFLIGSMC